MIGRGDWKGRGMMWDQEETEGDKEEREGDRVGKEGKGG